MISFNSSKTRLTFMRGEGNEKSNKGAERLCRKSSEVLIVIIL